MNTRNKTKGLIIASIIAFAATIFTACVPTPGGGGTTPSGTFNVGTITKIEQSDYLNINDYIPYTYSGIPGRELTKTINFDGDLIDINTFVYFIDALGMLMKLNYIHFDIQNNQVANSYELLNFLVDSMTLVDSNSHTTIDWVAMDVNPTDSVGNIFSIPVPDLPAIKDETFTGSTEKHVVFRKLKANNQYLYCWIKVKLNILERNIFSEQDGFVYLGLSNFHYKYELQVLNGKYQLNSITTGL